MLQIVCPLLFLWADADDDDHVLILILRLLQTLSNLRIDIEIALHCKYNNSNTV